MRSSQARRRRDRALREHAQIVTALRHAHDVEHLEEHPQYEERCLQQIMHIVFRMDS